MRMQFLPGRWGRPAASVGDPVRRFSAWYDRGRKAQGDPEKYMKEHPHHIPLLFMADVIHGCRTIAPIPLGQACSFHPELVEKMAGHAAAESAAEGIKATFSPMMDVSRDPRWGRIMESFGEDPFLSGVMGTVMLRGYQKGNGNDQKGSREIPESGIAGCLKHFAGYGAVNAGREYNDVEISQRTFREQYLKPFRMAMHADPAMVMTAFNAVDRRPVSGNKELLEDILRKEMGFSGTVISDWGAVGQLEEQNVVSGQAEAADAAVHAGVDIDMMSPAYMFHLEELVEEGHVPVSLIDRSAWNVLVMKNRLGLFEDPFAGMEGEEQLSAEAKKIALALACESSVLLKNADLLPLKPEQKVFWAGPYVESTELLSRWAIFGRHDDVETISEVLRDRKLPVRFVPGCEILTEEERRLWQADTFQKEAGPIFQAAAVGIGAGIEMGRQEFAGQIAVGAVELDSVETSRFGPSGSFCDGVRQFMDLVDCQGLRFLGPFADLFRDAAGAEDDARFAFRRFRHEDG